MGQVYRESRELEQFLIRRFVRDALDYTIFRAKRCDTPDAVLTLRKGQVKTRVAIEHTSYFCDTVPGKCSPVTPIADFWKRVQISLARRIGQRRHLWTRW